MVFLISNLKSINIQLTFYQNILKTYLKNTCIFKCKYYINWIDILNFNLYFLYVFYNGNKVVSNFHKLLITYTLKIFREKKKLIRLVHMKVSADVLKELQLQRLFFSAIWQKKFVPNLWKAINCPWKVNFFYIIFFIIFLLFLLFFFIKLWLFEK